MWLFFEFLFGGGGCCLLILVLFFLFFFLNFVVFVVVVLFIVLIFYFQSCLLHNLRIYTNNLNCKTCNRKSIMPFTIASIRSMEKTWWESVLFPLKKQLMKLWKLHGVTNGMETISLTWDCWGHWRSHGQWRRTKLSERRRAGWKCSPVIPVATKL